MAGELYDVDRKYITVYVKLFFTYTYTIFDCAGFVLNTVHVHVPLISLASIQALRLRLG